jgi:hypothetical protein
VVIVYNQQRVPYNRFNPPDSSGAGPKRGLGNYIQAEKLMQIAFVPPVAIALCWVGGWWLSNRFHMKWMELVAIMFGCVVGLVYVVQTAVGVENETRMRNSTGNGDGKGTGAGPR